MEDSLPKKITRRVPKKLDQLETIKRHVHYYRLLIGYPANTNERSGFNALMKAVIKDNSERAATRFFVYDNKTFCIQGLTIKDEEKLAYGMLCTIRSEDFPRFFNMQNDSQRDVAAEEFEGIVELSHFVINYGHVNPNIALEYNQYGGRIQDVARYLDHIGKAHGIAEGVFFNYLVHDGLARIKKRMGRISKLTAKVHRNMIPQIRNMQVGLATALDSVGKQFESEDITLILKFDYRHRTDTKTVGEMVDTVIDKFSENKTRTENFVQFTVEAEDKEQNNILQAFDLLVDKVRSTIKVQKNRRNRTIITNVMYQNMIVDMRKLNL